jgi:hypothetical protein
MAAGLGEEGRGGLLRIVGRREGVHALRHLVHGALQVGPRPVDRDVRFDQALANLHRALPAVESSLSGGTIYHHDLLAPCIIDGRLALLLKFFQLAIARGVGNILAHTVEQDFLLNVSVHDLRRIFMTNWPSLSGSHLLI